MTRSESALKLDASVGLRAMEVPTDDVTVEAWVNLPGWDDGGAIAGDTLLIAREPALAADRGTIPKELVPCGRWIHLASTRKDGTTHLFVSGKEVASGAVKAPDPRVDIGRGFRGLLGEVRVWKRALTLAELRSNAVNPPDDVQSALFSLRADRPSDGPSPVDATPGPGMSLVTLAMPDDLDALRRAMGLNGAPQGETASLSHDLELSAHVGDEACVRQMLLDVAGDRPLVLKDATVKRIDATLVVSGSATVHLGDATVEATFAEDGAGPTLTGLRLLPRGGGPFKLRISGALAVHATHIAFARDDRRELAMKFAGQLESGGARLDVKGTLPSSSKVVTIEVVEPRVAPTKYGNILSLAGEGVFKALAAELAQLPESVGVELAALDVGIDVEDLSLAALHVHLKGDKLRWVVRKDALELVDLDLDLEIQRPTNAALRHFTGTIDGRLKLGTAEVAIRLSNRIAPGELAEALPPSVTRARAEGRWLLTPQPSVEPIVIGGLRDLLQALHIPALVDAIPEPLRDLGAGGELRGLAIGLDPDRRWVSLVAGRLTWKDVPLPGLPNIQLTLWTQLEIEDPFDTANWSLELGGQTTVAQRRLTLTGKLYKRAPFELRAQLDGKLSLTEGLGALLGQVDASLTAVVSDYLPDVALESPELLIQPGAKKVSFRCGVVLEKELAIGGLRLKFKPDTGIAFERDDQRCTLTLRARLETPPASDQSGLRLDDLGLSVWYESGARSRTTAILEARIELRDNDSSLGKIRLLARYLGKGNGCVLVGALEDKVALAPAFRALLAGVATFDLPPELAGLELTALRLSYDTKTGDYQALAKTRWAPAVGGETIKEVEFSVDLGKTGAESHVKLAASVDIRGMQFALTAEVVKDAGGQGTIKITGLAKNIRLRGLLEAFKVDALDVGDAALETVELRYEDHGPPAEAVKPGQPRVAAKALRFSAAWGEGGHIDILMLADGSPGASVDRLIALKPGGLVPWLHDAQVAYAMMTDPKGSIEGYPAGLTLEGRVDLARVGVKNQLRVAVGRERLQIDVLDEHGLAPPAMKPLEWPGGREEAPAAGALPVTATSGERTFVLVDSLSLAPVVQCLSPGKGGWRDYIGNCLVIEKLAITPHRPQQTAPADAGTTAVTSALAKQDGAAPSPRPFSFTVSADASATVGKWVSASVQRLAVRITTKGLSRRQLAEATMEWTLQGAAVHVDLAPYIRGGAAVSMYTEPTDPPGACSVAGVGELSVLGKIRVAALAYAHLVPEDGRLTPDALLAFVVASGFRVPIGPVELYGLAGGFALNVLVPVPRQPNEVRSHALLGLLREDPEATAEGNAAKAMLAKASTFTGATRMPGAVAGIFGLTVGMKPVLSVSALASVELRPTGLEAALLLAGDLILGAGPPETRTAEIYVDAVARYSSAEGTISFVGGISDKSWLFDRKCRLRGGWAFCYWLTGPQKGDFVLSIGGYSPLAPKRPHYPPVERLGIDWEIDARTAMFGEMYLCIDRYGVGLGAKAGLKYVASKVRVEAFFSFDALVEFDPLYYEAKLLVNVQVEVRYVVTLRLGLDVNLHVFGPPFGAHLDVTLKVWPVAVSVAIDVGATYAEVQARRAIPPFATVLADLRGNKLHCLGLAVGDQQARYDASKKVYVVDRSVSADGLFVRLDSPVPLRAVELRPASDAAAESVALPTKPETRFEVRRARVRDVASTLRIERGVAPWELRVEEERIDDVHWCEPAKENEQTPWKEPARTLIRRAVLRAPGDSGGEREHVGTPWVVDLIQTLPSPETEAAPRLASPAHLVDGELQNKRTATLAALGQVFSFGRGVTARLRAFEEADAPPKGENP